jgi:hypothetical protein
MKSKLSMKLLGIVVTIATVSSLLVGITAAPVSAAPGTLSYGSVSAPSNANNVLGGTAYHFNAGGTAPDGFAIDGTPNVDLIASTADGSTMFAWDNTVKMLYTSTNAAVSWTARSFTGTNLTAAGGLNPNVIKLLVSPTYATDGTVVLVTPVNILVSTNSGNSFTASSPPDLEGGLITSADIGQYFSDGGAVSVIIGMTAGTTALYSNVEKLKLPSLYPWTQIGKLIPGAGNAGDLSVYGLAFSKSHATDAEIIAVTNSVAGAGFGALQVMSSFANIFFGNAATLTGTTATATTQAVIAMGSDYSGFGFSNTLAIGTNAATVDDVYRVTGRTNSLPGSVIDTHVAGGTTASTINSIVINGTAAAGTVLVGLTFSPVIYSATTFSAGPAVTYVPASDPPTGLGGCTVLWVGTNVFAGTTGADGGVSSSTDAGVHFNQLSLINVGPGSGSFNPAPWVAAATSNLSNMSLVSLNAVDANNMFLIMADSNAFPYSSRQLWVTSNGGTSWTRVLTSLNMGVGPTGSIAFVAPSSAYATDHTFYVSQGTLGTTNTVLMSTNSGVSFNLSISSAQQSAVIYKNGTLYYGGSAPATFYKLMRFSPASFPAGETGTVASIAFSPTDTTGATIAVGMTTGNDYLSTNDGVSFTKLGASAGGYLVAYGPDGSLYAATITKISRWVAGTSSFLAIDGTGASTATVNGLTGISGLAVTPDGTLYASDAAAATLVPIYNDVWRSLSPTKGDVTSTGNFAAFQPVPSTSFTSGASAYLFSGISIVSTTASNTLYLVDTNKAIGVTSGTSSGYAGSLQAFIDTFIVGPVLTSPANGALLTTQDRATLSWTAMTGAYVYQIGVNDASTFAGNDFSGDGTANVYSNPLSTTPTSFVNKGNPTNVITAGGTYYWRVRATSVINGAVTGNLFSRYSTPTWSFITALATPGAGVGTPMFPLQGSTNVPVNTTFTWPASPTPGATYEFVIAEELGNVDKFAIIDYSATAPTNATILRETLKYDTTYWWRVRTVTGTSKSDWTTYFFTTEPEPVASSTTATTPVVTPIVSVVMPSNTPVTPIVNVSGGGTTAPAAPVIPTYLLWAVIVVGAVLVIAVIVLIVRTRRIP